MTAPPHLAHGWNATPMAPDWPPLRADEAAAVLARYPSLSPPLQLRWHSPRPFSAAARVACAQSEVFLKRHHAGVRSAAQLAEEHAFIAHLRAHGLPVPRVLTDANGHSAIALGEWTYEVHALAEGLDLYRDAPSWTPPLSAAHARSAGRMLARLHLAARDYAAPARSTALLVTGDAVLRASDPLAAIAQSCAQRPGLAAALATRDWAQELAPLLPALGALQPRLAALPTCWTHGDWHVSNLLWDGPGARAGVAAILDFGLCAPTFALLDLATAIERNAIAWLDPDPATRAVFPEIARALLAGYAELLPLSRADTDLLADLLPLAHLDFALSELEYFHAVLRQPAMAAVAWRDFLLGHFAWLAQPRAQALLQAIRGAG
ncbi:phosphotransferase [Thermomonas sp. S9]|uniref:phosphotransferase enzyme family protein n=1 Tax=Thermomonas sp. S9 TaxID=2885203 RepID=UPI00216ACAC6|nr:phosphotransferase [Thermomonas sp. S9]MCR6496931.1 phosphotransferase [Thermomonas sp. S9]